MRKLHYYVLSLAIVAADIGTKQWASQALKLGKSKPLFQGMDLTLAHNKGAAFSFLAQQNGWQQGFFVGIAVVVSLWFAAWLARTPTEHHATAFGLALIMGGAVGNLIDRLLYGYVIDFIDLYWGKYHWPAFNLADTVICLGAALLFWGMLRGE